MNDLLTLSDILGRVHSVQWHEAVALVRGVAEQLLEGTEAMVPELHQIQISPAGQVGISGGAIADEPVRRLGQLLHAALGHSELPVQLRLVMVQATATTPAYGSIREYDEALAYFERPDRGAVLQALYARAATVPSDPESKFARLDTLAPLPAPERPENAAKRKSANSKPRTLRLVVGGALVLVACAGGVYYATTAGAAAGNTSVSAIAEKAADAVTAAATAGLSAVTERAGLGRLVPAETVSTETAAPAAPVAKRARAKRATAPESHPDVPIIFFDLDPLPAALSEGAIAIDRTTAFPGNSTEVAVPDGERIFSSSSEGVSPPVGVRPQLPRELPADLTPDQLTRLELIVSEAGTVDSVKLLGTPRTVHDFMFVSAAKAWLFQPALKDGQPVRYRKTVWLASR